MSANPATLAAAPRNKSKYTVIPTPVGVFGRIMLRIREYATRRSNRAVLYAMSDRALKDIGLCRGDIERVTRM